MGTQGIAANAYHIVDAIELPTVPDFSKERDRLLSFANWPVPHILPEVLARWGFYYTGHSDIVQCYFCTIKLGQWDATDVVEQEHLKWSRYCPLMTKRRTDNVPTDPNFLNQLPDIVPDVYGSNQQPYGWEELNQALPVLEPERTLLPGTSQPAALVQDATKTIKPAYPKYATEAARFSSFESWPKSIKQTPAQMADAGFFYTEKNDTVVCFSCGGTLNGWEPEDEPWVEHAANFTGCHYLNLMKDHAFVEQCQTMRAQSSTSTTEVHHSKTSEQKQESKDTDVADEKMCKICYVNPYNTTFVPCGHVVACAKCASAVDRCPMCNQPFRDVFRVYFG